ncbi:MAG: PolC-type DNA polymerase III [Eubacteriales bacterium]
MNKLFFEVFPTLQLEGNLKDLFGEVEVTKVATTSLKDKLKIYILSRHLIFKKNIYEVENKIKGQMFANTDMKIEIVERFQLSEQYTPLHLMNEYKESVALELERENVIVGSMFRRSEFSCTDEDDLTILMKESIISEGKKDVILGVIRDVFENRCQMTVNIHVEYQEMQRKRKIDSNAEIQQEINRIMRNLEQSKNEALENQEGSATDNGQKAAGETSFKKSEMKKDEKQSFYTPPVKKSDNADVIYGRDFEEECIDLNQVITEMGEIVFRGKVIDVEIREIRNEKSIIMFDVTDFTDTIRAKMFVKNAQLAEVTSEVKKGAFLKVKGMTILDKFDKELTIGSVFGIKKIPDFTTKRMDTSSQKRVELHCHTKMSDMDGVSDVKAIVNRAHDWGHKAIAITDHGGVQSFPVANHVLDNYDKNDPFKIIYGMEAYIVDDLTDIAINEKGQTLDDTYIVFDIETTGFSSIKDKIIEIGAVKVLKGEIIDTYSTFVNPERPIPFKIEQLTGINDNMVMEAPTIEAVLPEFLKFVGEAVLVAHNASFDVGFIEQNCRYQDIVPDFTSLDTVGLARVLLPNISKYKLNVVAKALGISLENHHRAVDDARATAEIFLRFLEMLKEQHIFDLKEINQFGIMNTNAIRKLPTFHAIILAKNTIGRFNLYSLVSMSHLTYFARRPRIPKSLFNQYKEGLIIGSACEAGELYQAFLNNKSSEQIAKLADFYDYYEIQPLGNNQFMLESDKFSQINSNDDLIDINKKIVKLGEQFNKPVVATCDVHFLDPEDATYRAIIMAGKGFADADNQPPLFLRTTEEMLAEFEYLGADKAYEVVVESTNTIADMVEKITPVRPDKCPPVIENSDQELRDICYDKAHEWYGKDLPEMVVARLERELNSIISNGYSVMYIIAQKLVWDSVDAGYLVGSRGSVGSSFVATMAGITEVNPLSPHYRCGSCFYSEFDSEEVKEYAGGCGFDMPDKVCPKCGKPLTKDGFDIPFETFLGFYGDKEPDIDLNFSGEYQANAHRYTEVLFGKGQTFKAGTIGTLAEKTAFGYVRNYYEERGVSKRTCEINRLLQGCTKIRRSTGQHPGGIIVLPHGENINSFTPVQHPANDMKTDIITTHFDYHSIDHNLLKLDILGHDDPTMIKMLEDLVPKITGEPFDATHIPLDDKGVMDMFAGTEVLGISPSDIGGTPVGCLGIPEFGTDFVIQMVVDAKPQSLSDLIRISGLSHGTDVWLGNAQTLIQEGLATISTAICTRDDIMTFLINTGMESGLSFTIMESVRKGKGLKPDWIEAMLAANVPQWYIDSCLKIKYMFPKAHAAAYVMMAYRIAYCKLNYPLAYYGAYFSIRADAFSYEIMCQGRDTLEYYMNDYKHRSNELSNKEQETMKDMRLVQEMYARGLEFMPLDIYTAKAKEFQIIDGKLMPSLASIEGLGEKAAEAVEQAGKCGKYLSLDDFRQRTKATQTAIDLMAKLNMFGDLPKSNQLSLFDM